MAQFYALSKGELYSSADSIEEVNLLPTKDFIISKLKIAGNKDALLNIYLSM